MKNLKLFIATFLFVFAVQISVANVNPLKTSAKLQAELVQLLGSETSFEIANAELTAEVIFTINTHGEVVVISVTSDNPEAEKYIKSKINYKKVSQRATKPGEMFLLPVKVVKA